MKKIAKMSLVAAVAVAGLSSTASATALEEAIKGTDLSGYVRWRYTDDSTKQKDSNKLRPGATYSAGDANRNGYKVSLTFVTPISEDIKMQVAASAKNKPSGAGASGTAEWDGGGSLTLKKANFTYTGIENVTAIVGLQALATPVTNPADTRGSGAIALGSFGPVTVAGGYIKQSNITNQDYSTIPGLFNPSEVAGSDTLGVDDLSVAAVIGSFGPVTAQAWYHNLAEAFQAWEILADANFDLDAASIGIHAAYAALNYTSEMAELVGSVQTGVANKAEGNSYFKASVTADLMDKALALRVGYAGSANKGGLVSTHQWSPLAQEAGEQFSSLGDNLLGPAGAATAGRPGLALWYGTAYYTVGKFGIGVDALGGKFKDQLEVENVTQTIKDIKVQEYVGRLAYNWTDAFKTSTYYSFESRKYDNSAYSDTDNKEFRIEAKYSF